MAQGTLKPRDRGTTNERPSGRCICGTPVGHLKEKPSIYRGFSLSRHETGGGTHGMTAHKGAGVPLSQGPIRPLSGTAPGLLNEKKHKQVGEIPLLAGVKV